MVCLCASWCGVCRDYQPAWQALAQQHPELRFIWLDVEDDAEMVGDLDVETFPTLLIADDQGPRFCAALAPQVALLERLLQSLRQDADAERPHSAVSEPEVLALWQALARRQP